MGWIFRAQQFQGLHGVPDNKMVELAAAHLLGDAIPSYQWLARTMGRPTWSAFTRALCSHFGSPEDDDPEGSLAKLRQTTTVRDYQAKIRTACKSKSHFA